MRVTMEIAGINLERLLRAALEEGISLAHVRRTQARALCVRVRLRDSARLAALCARSGWSCREVQADALVRAWRMLARRAMLPASLLLALTLVWLSSHMILGVHIEHAQAYGAQVREILKENGARPGALKAGVSLDDLRARLAFFLPGLRFAGLRYEGSVLMVDCYPAVLGEQLAVPGKGDDIVAAQPGIITRISVSSGTPQVKEGQAVHRGQVLISGTERTQKGELRSVRAQGQVSARVFARGEARVSLVQAHTVETGRTRTRVTVRSPWHARVVQDAQPFASQDVSRRIQPVVALFVPLWREIETYAETVVHMQPRDRGDAASMAQGAAEKIAKEQCPQNALILDKIVNYSMIDNEFVYATVVLEYEASIAGRIP